MVAIAYQYRITKSDEQKQAATREWRLETGAKLDKLINNPKSDEQQKAAVDLKRKVAHAPGQKLTPLTLKQLFDTDFHGRMSANEGNFPLTIGSKSGKFPETTYTFTTRIYFDMEEGTQFFAFYIPSQDRDPEQASKKTVELCKKLPFQFPELYTRLHGLEEIEPTTRGSTLKSSELPLSRRVFIYHEDFISPPDLGDLVREYEARQLLPEFRGDDYLGSQELLRALGQRK